MDNMHRQIASKEMEQVITKVPNKWNQALNGPTG